MYSNSKLHRNKIINDAIMGSMFSILMRKNIKQNKHFHYFLKIIIDYAYWNYTMLYYNEGIISSWNEVYIKHNWNMRFILKFDN